MEVSHFFACSLWSTTILIYTVSWVATGSRASGTGNITMLIAGKECSSINIHWAGNCHNWFPRYYLVFHYSLGSNLVIEYILNDISKKLMWCSNLIMLSHIQISLQIVLQASIIPWSTHPWTHLVTRYILQTIHCEICKGFFICSMSDLSFSLRCW